MQGSARFSDVWVGICCCHPPAPCIGMSGVIVTGSNDVTVNNLPKARFTDIVVGGCGHTGIIVTSSNTVTTNGLGSARSGDSVTGCCIGVIATGSTDTLIGG